MSFSFFGKKSSGTVGAEQFVKTIEELGYFKYANSKDVEVLKEKMIHNFNPESNIIPVWNDNSSFSLDYRFCFCDGEDLYEMGGFTKILSELQPVFEKINLTIAISDDYEEWDDKNDWLNHTITINGTKYIIFKNFKEQGWGEATQRLVEILNEELEKQKNEERVYPISAANEGMIVFLTPKLFSYIDSIYKNKKYSPLSLKDWCREMDISYMSVK